jgi:hypothetical protein
MERSSRDERPRPDAWLFRQGCHTLLTKAVVCEKYGK